MNNTFRARLAFWDLPLEASSKKIARLQARTRKEEMASTSGDTEIRAIEQVIEALDPLDADARTRVIDYAFKRLEIDGFESLTGRRAPAEEKSPEPPENAPDHTPRDIRTLKEEKKPKSANEMAAIVGYYLAELAPEADRKTEIGTTDIEKYFKQAQHRLPGSPRKTLPNAMAAGYFDSAGRGLYTLNPVGHNLVAHSLPRASSSSPAPRTKRAKKSKKSSSKAKSARKGKSKAPSKAKTKRKRTK